MDYKKKYLKYRAKYLNLKKMQKGGMNFISISNKNIQEVSTVKTFIVELKGAQLSSGSVSLISSSAVPVNFYITAGVGS